MAPKEQIQEARRLIKDKQYDEARSILETIENDMGRQWLAKLDGLQARTPTRSHSASDPPITGTAETRRSSKPVSGLILMLVAAIIGGAATGGLLFASSLIYYAICFSPIIAAVIGGYVLAQAVKLGKVRSALAALLLGMVMGVVIYGTYRYAEYWDVRKDWRDDILAEEPAMSDALANTIIDEWLYEETGFRKFWGFVKMDAEEGMTIIGNRSGTETTLSENVTMGYWVFELILMLGIPTGMALSASLAPFCEETNQWLELNPVGHITNTEDIASFIELFNAGEYAKAQPLLEPGDLYEAQGLVVEMARGYPNAPEGWLKITQKNGNKSDTIFDKQIPLRVYDAVLGTDWIG